MGAFSLIILVLSFAFVTLGEEDPCPAEGCKNITIYLGPRFGSKTLRVPNFPKTKEPSDDEAKKVNVSRSFDVNSFIVGALGVTNKINTVGTGVPSGYYPPPRGTGSPEPRHRPIPDDDTVVVDDSEDVEEFRERNDAMRWQSYSNPPANWGGAVLNFVGLDFAGSEVKDALSRVSEEDSKRVSRLYLGSNKIEFLQPLTFPVALEYSLQELWLDHNPLTHLTSYTRFEISRLGNLKVLNLSSTGLSYLEPPYLPALEVLDLSHNQVSFLPSSISSRLGSLRVLDLSHNLLHGIYDPDFSGLVNLQVLDLSNNNIAYLSPDAFKKMYSLNTLYLNKNRLNSLTHVRFPQSARLYLSNNFLECSCPLLALYQQTWPGIGDKYNVTCFEYGEWRRVWELQESDVHIECERSFGWLRVRAEKIEAVTQWLKHHHLHLSSVWALAGCTLLLIVVLVFVVQLVRRVRTKRARLEVPYNILDDKNVQQA